MRADRSCSKGRSPPTKSISRPSRRCDRRAKLRPSLDALGTSLGAAMLVDPGYEGGHARAGDAAGPRSRLYRARWRTLAGAKRLFAPRPCSSTEPGPFAFRACCALVPRSDDKIRGGMAYLLGHRWRDGEHPGDRLRPGGPAEGLARQRLSRPISPSRAGPSRTRRIGGAAWAKRCAARSAAAGISADQIIALAVDTTCCSVVAVDADGAPLRPAMIWMDVRSAAEAADVAASGDPALRINSDGRGPVSAEWMIPKSLWMKRHQPELFGEAARICEYQDYINWRLTGRWVASLEQHGGALALPEPRGRTAASLLAKLGLADLEAEMAAGDRAARRCHRRPSTRSAAEHLGLDARHSGGARRRRRLHRRDRPWRHRAGRDGADHRVLASASRHRRPAGPWRRHLGHLHGCGLSRQADDRRRPDLDRLGHRLVQAPLRAPTRASTR